MATLAPDRTLEQRQRALEMANAVRSWRSELKRDLGLCAHARRDVVALLLDPPRELETMKLFDLMLAMPSYGRVKVSKILKRCRVSPTKTVEGLSERQRREVVSMLGARLFRCSTCGEWLRDPSEGDRCGFCIEEGL